MGASLWELDRSSDTLSVSQSLSCPSTPAWSLKIELPLITKHFYLVSFSVVFIYFSSRNDFYFDFLSPSLVTFDHGLDRNSSGVSEFGGFRFHSWLLALGRV